MKEEEEANNEYCLYRKRLEKVTDQEVDTIQRGREKEREKLPPFWGWGE